ncbi:MAG: DHH family phosphoesterase [Candidatus Omnitrophica bacterium]|nr:DHH family phosphoesterase [Candidatus Omnitrophota bacterium]MCM8807919.1 DHH family phosphoesterase [Candidatus Omnitrophota bacterium]
MIEIHPILRKILHRRNIISENDIKKFLFPTIDDLIDPCIIEMIEEASDTILKAIKNRDRIFIYGDGDVDGIGGVFFLIKFLQNKNVNFNYYLTHRLEDYEIEENLVDYFLKEKYKLLIFVDCGISSYRFLKKCAENGLKVIVIDHHQTELKYLPEDHIYIHPFFTLKEIDFSATGLSFKLFQSLSSNYFSSFSDYIVIAGLSVLSENLNLMDDNRIFVKEMIKDLKNSTIKGLNLIVSRYLNSSKIEVEDINKLINPKLNSPGRFGKPEISLNLLLEEKENELENLLREIESLDKKRYQITQDIMKNVEKFQNFDERFIIVENLSPSFCGIIASRLVEKYNLPFLVMSKKGNIIKGSGRSPENFNLYENLKKIKDKFISFGGHKNAVGFKFHSEKEKEIKEYWINLKVEKREKECYFDIAYEIENIKPEILENLELLKPFGKGNPPPVFLSKNVFIKKIKKGNEYRYWAKKNDVIFECKVPDPKEIKEGTYDILYTPEIQKKDGYYRIILEIKNFK